MYELKDRERLLENAAKTTDTEVLYDSSRGVYLFKQFIFDFTGGNISPDDEGYYEIGEELLDEINGVICDYGMLHLDGDMFFIPCSKYKEFFDE